MTAPVCLGQQLMEATLTKQDWTFGLQLADKKILELYKVLPNIVLLPRRIL